MRSCQNCYYCINSEKIGGSMWCVCSNLARSSEADFNGRRWGRSRLNLPCWLEDIPVAYDFEDAPQKVFKLNLAKKSFLHWYIDRPRDVTVPWSYMVLSRLKRLFQRNKGLQ
jgi:hypothetical protein